MRGCEFVLTRQHENQRIFLKDVLATMHNRAGKLNGTYWEWRLQRNTLLELS
jgi:hypothetical protein